MRVCGVQEKPKGDRILEPVDAAMTLSAQTPAGDPFSGFYPTLFHNKPRVSFFANLHGFRQFRALFEEGGKSVYDPFSPCGMSTSSPAEKSAA